MRRSSLLILSLCAYLCTFALGAAHAQTASVSGHVRDAINSSELGAASVRIYDGTRVTLSNLPPSKHGAIADAQGRYHLQGLEPGQYTLVVTYTGYKAALKSIELTAGQSITQDFALTPDPKGAEEIVITGVASERTKSVAEVAVSRVDAGQLTQANTYQDISQLLSGRVSGVTVSPSSGNVGSGIRFNVRSGAGLYGTGQPVIFIDGVRVNDDNLGEDDAGGQTVSALSDIDPQDIDHIDFLKGPAASALYGTSGSNGVVLITTKRGSSGTPGGSSVQIRSTFGMNKPVNLYTRDMALSFADANATMRTGGLNEQQVSLIGSTGQFNYFTSFTHRFEEGILYNNQLDRNSIRANFGAMPLDNLRVNVSSNYIFSGNNRPENDNTISGPLAETLTFGPDENGASRSYPDTDSLSISKIRHDIGSQRFIGSVEAISTIGNNVVLRGLVGLDALSSRTENLYPPSGVYAALIAGSKYVSDVRTNQVNFDLSGTYTTSLFTGATTDVTLGTQGFSRTSEFSEVLKNNFANDNVTNVGAGADFGGANDGLDDSREAGIYLRAENNYRETYFLTLGVRNDYASSIGTDAPSILYPQASAAVRLDKLDLIPEDFNLVKLRAAYGESGVLPGPLDGASLRWGAEQSGSGAGAVISVIGNPAIEPERIKEFEVGAEIELMNAYGIDFTYYLQNASNSIIDFINAPSTGLTASSIPKNVGEIKGWGFESQLYATPIRDANTQLDLNLIWNYANNEVTGLGGAQPIFDGFGINVIKEGLPRSAFYGYKALGAKFDEEGVYAGALIDSEKSYLGTPTPKHTGSFGLSLRFLKNITVSANSDWGLGHSIYSAINLYLHNAIYENNARIMELRGELGLSYGNPNASALVVGSPEYNSAANELAMLSTRASSPLIEKADFFRLREVSVRYDATDFLNSLFDREVFRSISLIASGRNLFLSTKYSFPDPEVNWDGGRSLSKGQDFGTLPNPAVYNFTVSLGL